MNRFIMPWIALAVALGAGPGRAAAPKAAKKPVKAAASKSMKEALMHPEKAVEKAPEKFQVNVETTKGPFTVEVVREWAPKGADRFYNLIRLGYYDDVAFFRVLDGFVAQFGIHGDPKVSAVWRSSNFEDDPVGKQSNARGTLTFATAGPNTRTTQLFINFRDNSQLDSMGFTPFGRVVKGMEVVDSLYKGYGEGAPRGAGPDQGMIQTRGNAYLKESFPKLDFIKSARVAESKPAKGKAKKG